MSVDPELEHLRPLAIRYATPVGSKTGTVNFQSCPCCGAVRWSSSAPTPTDDLTIHVYEDFSIDNCRGCNEVRHRAPEIFDWVASVVLHQIGQALKALKDEPGSHQAASAAANYKDPS